MYKLNYPKFEGKSKSGLLEIMYSELMEYEKNFSVDEDEDIEKCKIAWEKREIVKDVKEMIREAMNEAYAEELKEMRRRREMNERK